MKGITFLFFREVGFLGQKKQMTCCPVLCESIILGDVLKVPCAQYQMNSTGKCYRSSTRLWLEGWGNLQKRQETLTGLYRLSGIQKGKWEGEDIPVKDSSDGKALL